MNTITNNKVASYWRALRSFRNSTSSLIGYDGDVARHLGAGRLEGAERDRWFADRDHLLFVVLSYNTPIAWVTKDGVVHRVADKFSVTTTRHQGLLWPTPLYATEEDRV